MGLLGDLSAWLDNRKRVVGQNVQDLTSGLLAPQWAAQAKEDLQAHSRDMMSQPLGEGAWDRWSPLALNMVNAIKVYHGSPHTFDKFDMSKIGTGEGAQAYGHGLYFAENPGVAGGYARALGNREFQVGDRAIYSPTGGATNVLDKQSKAETVAAQFLDDAMYAQSSSPAQYAANRLRQHAKQYPEDKETVDAAMNVIRDWQAAGEKAKDIGNVYEVNLRWPDPAREAADPLGPQHFLDWDKPLSQQPRGVRDAVLAVDPQQALTAKGGAAYGDIRGMLDDPRNGPTASLIAASNALRAQGLPGIRYLDAGSRIAGDGTANYVLFDDALAEILRRNGVVTR